MAPAARLLATLIVAISLQVLPTDLVSPGWLTGSACTCGVVTTAHQPHANLAAIRSVHRVSVASRPDDSACAAWDTTSHTAGPAPVGYAPLWDAAQFPAHCIPLDVPDGRGPPA